MIVSFLFLFSVIMAIFGFNLKILQHREIRAQARLAVSDETKATNIRNIGKVLGILTLFTFVTCIPYWVNTALLILDVSLPIKTSLSDGLLFASMVLWVMCGCACIDFVQERHKIMCNETSQIRKKLSTLRS